MQMGKLRRSVASHRLMLTLPASSGLGLHQVVWPDADALGPLSFLITRASRSPGRGWAPASVSLAPGCQPPTAFSRFPVSSAWGPALYDVPSRPRPPFH